MSVVHSGVYNCDICGLEEEHIIHNFEEARSREQANRLDAIATVALGYAAEGIALNFLKDAGYYL